ncbi:eCIS core domain-containing protein [Sorangium sp. So ce542]|uniref:eCIS core domain-containing protein n=1 Tax=Sorangium sp. So ce542 TaxID=3133316 RepID=UPI003F60DF88
MSTQRALGNQATATMLRAQAKLAVGGPGDALDAEAAQGADRAVRRMTDPERRDPPRSPGQPLDPAARAGIAGPGAPLDPALARSLGQRLGADLSGVRIHTDAAAANAARALGARAFTYGHDIAFGRGAWAPATAAGLGLLTHELTHFVQQARGDTSTEEAQERAADGAAAGFVPHHTGGGAPYAALRLRPGDVQRVTITLGSGEDAIFRVDIEEGDPVTGSGTARGLDPGEYRLSPGSGGAAAMVVTRADGSPLPRTSRFEATVPRQVVPVIQRIQAPIPLIVRRESAAAPAPPVPAAGGPGGVGSGGEPATEQAQRQALDALPQRIRDFLFSATGSRVRPQDYATLLRIARAVADLTAEELAEYRARTVGSTTDVAEFERGVTAWLTEVRARRAAVVEEEAATRRLYRLEGLYELYAQWQVTTNTGGQWYTTGIAPPAGELARYEATPFASLRVPPGAYGWHQYYELRRALDAAGFANVGAFEAAIRRFLVGFRERAFYIALESLGRYEHFLIEQQARYRDAAVLSALHTRLSTARTEVEAADRYGRSTTLAGVHDPEDRGAAENHAEMREEHARMEQQARRSVAAATTTEPIVAQRDFDPLGLARQDRAQIGPYLQRFIAARLDEVRTTRDNLGRNHELIFRFDQLVATTKQRADIDENTIWSRAIADHSAPSLDSALFGLISGVLLIALTFATAGTGLPAALVALGSLGLSTYFAVEAYEDYAIRSDAYGAGLLSREPWFGWVVIAVIGVGLDLAAVGATLRALRPAAAALEATGDLAAFNTAVQDLVADPRVRRAVLEAAAARTQARAAWQAVADAPSVVPRGALRGSLFGLDVAIDAALALPRTVYALWLEARAGVRTFQRWILTPEAVHLFGDVAQFTPQRLREVQAIYEQASGALQRVAEHARGLGMSEAEIEVALQWWARSQRGSADDVLRVLDQRRTLTIDPAALTRMSAEVDVERVRLVAAAIDDAALRAELLRDERVWRMLANSDYDPATLLRAWREYRAPRPPSQQLGAGSFGEYLYNSSRYSTVLGRTPPRPLTAVIPNWGSLAGAARTQAVFQAAEPRLFAALAGAGPVPGLNPQTVSELRALLQTDVVGAGVTMYDGARSTVMGLANEIIGRTTQTEAELRAILALTDSSGSTGSIGERFLGQRLTHAAFSGSDLAHPSFTRAELPGLRGGGESFVPDRVLGAAHETLDVKTGYAGSIDVVDQAHNYELLRTVSQANPDIASRLGGPLRGHSWLVLPGADAATTPAQTVARRIWRQLEAEGLTTQRVFYLDETGAIQQVTGATTQTRAGATIHEAVGLQPPPAPPR